ncbi:MAG: hypothetical protein EOP92_22810 [Lysobacteraceae bacterium]|nr:MAG: hypothetical protein EOP92_22810 [Xanthomonadaceae bacterium]
MQNAQRLQSGSGIRIRNTSRRMEMVRTGLGVFCGAVIAALAFIGCAYLCSRLYPLPERLDPGDLEQLSAHFAAMPPEAVACILAGWALAGFAGGWTAAKTGGSRGSGAALAIGGVLTASVIVCGRLVPGPEWITVAGLLLPLPLATLAALLARRRDRVR